MSDPGFSLEILDVLQSMAPTRLFTRDAAPKNLSHKIRNDSFSVLPYDILLEVFTYLCTEELLILMTVSHHVNVSTRDSAF